MCELNFECDKKLALRKRFDEIREKIAERVLENSNNYDNDYITHSIIMDYIEYYKKIFQP